MTDPFAESPAALRRRAPEGAERPQPPRARPASPAEITVTETSPDGRVTLTVDADGVLTDLWLDDGDARPPSPGIGATVLLTLRRAQSRLPERAAEIIGAAENESDALDQELSDYRAGFPEIPVAIPAPTRAENGSRGMHART